MDTKTTSTVVPTAVGPLRIRRIGAGPPTFLWHSMFVDSETFASVTQELGRGRELFLVDGPGHGDSPGPRRLYSLQDCAAAAVQVMDALQVAAPVDWVGNAWGGHVGILLADSSPARIRTLVTIGTPAYPLSGADRRKTALLVPLYRILGPRPLSKVVVDALVGQGAAKSAPSAASVVAAAFQRGDRRGKYWAMRSLMLRRPDLRPVLPRLQVPTLMMAGRDDPMNDVGEAERAARSMPAGQFVPVEGGGHVAPLLVAPDEVTRTILEFWTAHG
ncbi:alpha/beta fold hydrolase [Arthrobacter zhaoxinii]|uniref:alpha/beta fold hydrolase n=1 Tax=Arthrobacter zhaoxinii TaxID=2964616 RepID=UPI002102A1C7|nr:alpha/beta hydrolase [Arthrobacter zhaoxinii]MCQ2000343.1 alpha/beta hydrolase [Arthrobacter zhaoxinii]